ncbi:MAG: hypothetical protein KF872_07140 [Chitinophagales bacterium]|nr:hypothetical protein [Chitinophagales bacterium]
MANHNSIPELQLVAMKETLNAVYILLADENISGSLFISHNKIINKCRYGYPSAILLFSFIDAVDTLYNKGKYKIAFRILNDEIFGSQNLKEKACDNLYDKYRSSLSHNLALPDNAFLIFSSENPKAFISNANPNKIDQVNLHALFKLCVSAFEHLNREHPQVFHSSERIKNIIQKGLDFTGIPKACDSPSGATYISPIDKDIV